MNVKDRCVRCRQPILWVEQLDDEGRRSFIAYDYEPSDYIPKGERLHECAA